MRKAKKPGPLLQAMLDNGIIEVERYTYVYPTQTCIGDVVYDDGVQLGQLGDEEGIEKYIAANPDPSKW